MAEETDNRALARRAEQSLAAIPNALAARSLAALTDDVRVLRFPDDRSVGTLYSSINLYAWAMFGPAQGQVRLSRLAHPRVKLELAPAEPDLSFLQALAPDALEELHWSWLPGIGLGRSQVTDSTLTHLRHLTALECLHLDGTRITDAGLVHLRPLTALRILSLQWTQITGAGLAHLRDLIVLRYLSLGGTNINDAELIHLPHLPALDGLDLESTKITDAGLVHLRHLTALQSLNLQWTRVTDKGLAHLRHLTALQELYLMDTKVTQNGLLRHPGLFTAATTGHPPAP